MKFVYRKCLPRCSSILSLKKNCLCSSPDRPFPVVASGSGFDSWQRDSQMGFNPNPALLTAFCLCNTGFIFSQQVCTGQRNVSGTKRGLATLPTDQTHSKHLSKSHEEEVDEKGAGSWE